MATVTIVPSADNLTGAWTESGGNSVFYDEVNEGIASADDDTTYVESDAKTSGSWGSLIFDFETLPSDLTSGGTVTAATMKLRCKCVPTDNDDLDITSWYVYDYPSGAITLASSVTTQTVTTSYGTFTQSLTINDSDGTNWHDNVYMQVNYTRKAIGMPDASYKFRISTWELEVVYTPAGSGAVKDVIMSGIIPTAR